RRVLNLFGAPSGLDFGTTTLTSTNRVQLANAGTEASLAGQFDIARMQVIQGGQSTPTLDLRATYDFRIDLAAGNLMVRAFDLNGTQQGRPFLRGELSEPLVWNWGGSGGEAGVSSLKLSVTNLALADWQALLGEGLSGRAGLQLTVASQQSGRQLNFDLAAWLQDLSVAAGTNRISGIDVQAGLRGTAADRMAFDYRLDVHGTQQRQEALPALSVSGKGNYNFDTTAAEVDVLAQSALPELFSLLAQPEMKAESGALLLNAKITQTGAGQVVLGEASLTNFTGHAAGSAFRHYGLNATFDIQSDAESIRIRDVHGTFSENGRAGGAFQLNGSHRIASSSGQFSVTLSDLNQNALRPFLESLFADKTLVSATLNATASADYDATDKPAIRAEIDLANLVVAGKQEQPPRALEAHLALDTTLQSTAAEIRKFELGLTPTQRAENRLHIAGRLDFSDTNALQGNLKIAADSLDLTSYYELFEPAPGTQPGTQTERPAGAIPEPAAAAQTEPEQEPEPIGIRFRNLVADASISRLYLREIEITNLQTRIHLDGAKFLMDPCRLVLNGAPVSARADVDLSVRGYAYALAFDADAVPFAPLVNTFQPDRKDQLGGTLSAHADIKGIGITGPSLQRSLAGSFDIGTTNLNLAPQNIRSPLLKLIVTVVSMVPDLAGNPQAALGTLAGSLVGSLTQKLTGGSMMEVTNSPIDIVHAEGTIANGRVELKQATVRSTVFQADAMGSVLLAPVLSNSTVNIPISIALTRPLAERINMVPPDTPTNALYVKLPDFFSAEGTLGQPRPRINTAALAVPVLKQFGVEIPGTGGTNTGVGGLLRGILNPQTPPPATDTNQPPATNQNPVGNILNRILGQ
ncbi:MAG TPA: AsmA family protein, partial [Verrucomicrobiota bacterium]|nr:AsmA family protein [Verrucomicrobiota bacterium]